MAGQVLPPVVGVQVPSHPPHRGTVHNTQVVPSLECLVIGPCCHVICYLVYLWTLIGHWMSGVILEEKDEVRKIIYTSLLVL